MTMETIRVGDRVRFKREGRTHEGEVVQIQPLGGPSLEIRFNDGTHMGVLVGEVTKLLPKMPMCEQCEFEDAQVVITLTNLQGEVLDTAKVCEECRKGSFTFRRDSIELA